MDLKQLQAIFFDFDGVILDSVQIKTTTFRLMFDKFGEEIVDTVIAHHKLHGGISRVEKLDYCYRTILEQPLSKQQLKHLCDEYSEIVMEQVVHSNWIAGAEAFLKKHHTKVDLLVVSGTPEIELKEIIKRRKMDRYFKKILGSPVKKPVHVNQAIKEFGYERDQCVFVGDALTDYHTARETGLHFVGVQGEVRFPEGTVVIPDCTGLEMTLQQL